MALNMLKSYTRITIISSKNDILLQAGSYTSLSRVATREIYSIS